MSSLFTLRGCSLPREINPRALTVSELKRELSKRGLVTLGGKDVLCRRLEGHLASELEKLSYMEMKVKQ